jgi:segregation and condensation protein A
VQTGEVALRSPELDLEVYQGPFDLLLSLIMKEEVDLLEVPLVEVITAYLEDMESAGACGYWDEMTEFLLLMSLLAELKSRLLLPGMETEFGGELTPEEARDQLLARLLVYSQFKAAASRLRELGEASARSLTRDALSKVKVKLPDLDEIAGTGERLELRDSLLRVIAHKGAPDTSHIVQAKVEVRRQIGLIRGLLAERTRFSFNEVFGNEEALVQALSVFALLDLLSRGEVRASQAVTFGDIVVRRRDMKKTA